MKRFVEGEDRRQSLLLPSSLDDYVTEDNPVRVIEVFVDELDLAKPASRIARDPQGHRLSSPITPGTLAQDLYSTATSTASSPSRRPGARDPAQPRTDLADRPTGPGLQDLSPTSAKDNGPANLPGVCKEFILLCRRMKLFTEAPWWPSTAASSRAGNNRDRNFTDRKLAGSGWSSLKRASGAI